MLSFNDLDMKTIFILYLIVGANFLAPTFTCGFQYNLNKSPFLTDRLYTDIENSILSMDYSQVNFNNLKNSHKKYIRYQPMPIANKIVHIALMWKAFPAIPFSVN